MMEKLLYALADVLWWFCKPLIAVKINKRYSCRLILLIPILIFPPGSTQEKTYYNIYCHHALSYLYEGRIQEAEKILDQIRNARCTYPIPWDAFQDGTINDIGTIYTFYCVLKGEAFWKAFHLTGKRKYLRESKRIAKMIIQEIGYLDNPDGTICFRYSDNRNDSGYRVHNINAYTAMYLIHFDKFLALRTIQFEINTQLKDGNWYYCQELKGRLNDLVHWSMIGTSFYRIFQETGDSLYYKKARKIKDDIVRIHINQDKTINDNGTKPWGQAELFVLLRMFNEDSLIVLLPSKSDPQVNAWIQYAKMYHN
jgi:hypothetical protein